MQQSVKTAIWQSAALMFLLDPAISAKYDEQTKSDLAAQRLSYEDRAYYIRKKLTAGQNSKAEITNSNDVEKVGFTNLDKRMIQRNTYLALTHIKLAYAADSQSGYAGLDVPSTLKYSSSDYFAAVPAKLLNSEFELINGDTRIYRGKISEFFVKGDREIGVSANFENHIELSTPKLIDWSKNVVCSIIWSDDALALGSAAAHYIEVSLKT